MTTIDFEARTAPARPAFFDGLRTVFNAPALMLKRRLLVSQTRKELSRLSDMQLEDIGIVRADIDAISATMAAHVKF